MRQILIGNPYTIQFNLLSNCIVNCSYCYLRKFQLNKISFEKFRFFLGKLEKECLKYNFSLRLNITGGDIWLHPEISQILKYSAQSSQVEEISLLLNNLWHKDARKNILAVKEKLNIIQLNLDTLEGRVADLDFLSSEEIPMVVKIFLSSDNNYYRHQLKVLKQIVKKYPNVLVSVDRFCPTNTKNVADMIDRKILFTRISELIKIAPDRFVTDDPLIVAWLKNGKSENCLRGCIIPFGGLAVFPNESIKVCSRVPSFETGFNIVNFDLTSYIKKFRIIHEQIRRECGKCKHFDNCQGGCPATSFVPNNCQFTRDFHCLSEEEGDVQTSNTA